MKTQEEKIKDRIIASKKYYEKNKEIIKTKVKTYMQKNSEKRKLKEKKYREENKETIHKKHAEQYQNNKEKLKTKGKEYYKKNKETIRKQNLLKLYNFSIEQYDIMFEEQKGCCKICGKHQSELNQKLSIDHCHKTGKVRGLLCKHCNHGLGKFKDDVNLLKIAIDYLNN
jgi:hypothetical protein